MKKITKGYMFDLDGTLYLEDQLLPGAIEILQYLIKKEIPFCMMTNNSSLSRSDYEKKLNALKLPVSSDQILTSAVATLRYLKNLNIKNIYLLGTPSIEDEFEQAGFILDRSAEDTEAVVLTFDKTINFNKMCIAHRLLMDKDVSYFATHPDIVCPMKEGTIPDCGAMIALFESSTGRLPKIIGKPEATMVQMASELLSIPVENLMIVGDRIYTDMQMGFDAGCQTALVLSGESTLESFEKAPRKPDLLVDNVACLLELIDDRTGAT